MLVGEDMTIHWTQRAHETGIILDEWKQERRQWREDQEKQRGGRFLSGVIIGGLLFGAAVFVITVHFFLTYGCL